MLVSWGRSAFAPLVQARGTGSMLPCLEEHAVCLWTAGFISNKAELLNLTDLPGLTSDHQLLVALYRRYGSNAPQKIAGPFAWILWDPERQALVVARDRMGNCGLYYALEGQTLLVANRVETLLGSLSFRSAFSARSIVAQINLEAPLDGETFYEKIKAVDPGGLLIVTHESITINRYWRIQPQPTLKLPTDAEYADAYRNLLFQVTAEYVPPDPIGVTLSSGMDSTSVAAAIRSVAPDNHLMGFSWIAPELPEADESWYLPALSIHLNVPLITIQSDLFWTLCNPEGVTTSAATPFYNYYTELWGETFRTIQQHKIHTVFSGSSGDHLFGGGVYPYADFLLTGRWLELVRQIRVILPYFGMNLKGLIQNAILGPIVRTYLPSRHKNPSPVPWLHKQYHRLYKECFARSDELLFMLPGRKQRLAVLRDRLLPHIHEQLNLQAARYDIDLRHVLVDHRLVEFALSLPAERTFSGMNSKFIVRNAMRGFLPDEIVEQYFKITPETIARRGLREREQAKMWSLLRNMRAAELGFVDENTLQKTYQDYCAGKQQDEGFWYTVTLEDWLRRYS